MKTLFLNYKYQASYITFIVFIPLLFAFFTQMTFLKWKLKMKILFL